LPEPTHETGSTSLDQNPSSSSLSKGIYWHYDMTTVCMVMMSNTVLKPGLDAVTASNLVTYQALLALR